MTPAGSSFVSTTPPTSPGRCRTQAPPADRGRRAAAVLRAFAVHGLTAGAALGFAYCLVLIVVASFGENDPALDFVVDAFVFAVPFGVGMGMGIGLVSGLTCGIVYAGLALAGGLPVRGSPRSWLLPLFTSLLTVGVARALLGWYFEPGDTLFVWVPAGLGALAGAAAGHQMLPQGSEEGSR
ncbi:MAG: hypothetical protein ACRD0C_05935 [Acidimicrobiia bacterium]